LASPNRSDYKFDTIDYSILIGGYIAIVAPILKEYHLSFSDLRIMAAIEALTHIFGWRLNGQGISAFQINKYTGFQHQKVRGIVTSLRDRGRITEDVIVQGKRTIYRYKLSKEGKMIVNKLCQTDKVHERIVDHLYKTRLLK